MQLACRRVGSLVQRPTPQSSASTFEVSSYKCSMHLISADHGACRGTRTMVGMLPGSELKVTNLCHTDRRQQKVPALRGNAAKASRTQYEWAIGRCAVLKGGAGCGGGRCVCVCVRERERERERATRQHHAPLTSQSPCLVRARIA